MSDEFIPIVTYASPPASEAPSKGLGEALFGDSSDSSKAINPKALEKFDVPARALEDKLTQLLQSVGGVLSNARQRAGELAGMELDEIELSVAITGQGDVSLIGLGSLQAGASGAMTFKFKRKVAAKPSGTSSETPSVPET